MLGGRAGLSAQMIGRVDSLGRLTSLVGALEHGHGSIAVVTGEPGIGKSRLVRELLHQLPTTITVKVGSAQPDSLGRPFDVVASALGDASGVAAVTEEITRVALAAPLVLVYEDLHWADAESCQVFERVAALGLPVLQLVTFRPEELSRRLPGGDMLTRLERSHQVETVSLGRLDRNEVAAFISQVRGATPPAAVVGALFDRSSGNPFVLEELLTAAREVPLADLAHQPLPWSLTDSVRSQLDDLDPTDRDVLEAAAVLGRAATFDVLSAMCERSEDGLIAALRRLVGAGLLVEPSEDHFEFRHALTRETVEGQLLGRERRRLYERALEAAGQRGDLDLASLAHLSMRAGRLDDAVDYARQGARHYLAMGSPFQAMRLAGEALDEAPDDVELLATFARGAWMVNLDAESLAATRRWLAATSTDDETIRALLLKVRLHHDLGQIEDLWHTASRIEALLVQVSDEARCEAMGILAQIMMLRGCAEESITWADRAIELAARMGRHDLDAQARVERATAMLDLPLPHDQIDAARTEAITAAEVHGDPLLVARAWNNLGGFRYRDLSERWQMVNRLQEAAKRAGVEMSGHVLYRVEMLEASGRQRDAFDLLRSLASNLLDTCVSDTAWAANLGAHLHAERRELEPAARLLDSTRSIVCGEERYWFAVGQLELSVIGHDHDHLEQCLIEVTKLLPTARNSVDLNSLVSPVELALMAGIDPAEVRARLIEPVRPLMHASIVQLADALVDEAAGQHHSAVAALQDALARPNRIGLPLRATVRLALARALEATGRREAAIEQLHEARTHLVDWPGWRRDAVDALTARLATRKAGAIPGPITPREREVALLLAEGLSNGEIAKRLYISTKTASVHVSNLLMKLDMSNRAEVAVWAARTLTDPT